MVKNKSLTVFTGSSSGSDQCWAQGVKQLAQAMIDQGWDLVYGGGNIGLMGAISQEVLRLGGHVTGVIPKAIAEKIPHHELPVLEVVEDMHQRKSRMYQLSHGFVALPGGIGTLEEFFEIFTWQNLGFHEKPVAIFNINGFYDTLIQFLDEMAAKDFVRRPLLDNLIVESDANVLLKRIAQETPQAFPKWK